VEEPSPIALALLAALGRKKSAVQYFASKARPLRAGIIEAVSGLPARHLDSWLMPADVSRHVFARSARRAGLSLIEGTYGEGGQTICLETAASAGGLNSLVEALDLPTIAVIEVKPGETPHLERPAGKFDALILDHLPRPEDYSSLSQLARLVYRRPVLGALEALPEARAVLAQAPVVSETLEAIERLANSFLRYADLEAIRQLAKRPFPDLCCDRVKSVRQVPLRVAYARDDAFGGYFPDTLEALEAMGAELVEFSPLADEHLPENVDLALIGCGFADAYAEPLARNLSLISDLRSKVCHGLRLYAEGGGAAYLGHTMILGRRSYPMAGILPIDATLTDESCCATPVEERLTRDTWLGAAGTTVRGYRTRRWRLTPGPEMGDCPSISGFLTTEHNLAHRKNAVGGLIHLHFAALPDVVDAFLGAQETVSYPPRSMR
jgi:cobyrinic acid a,c-diamide synthase